MQYTPTRTFLIVRLHKEEPKLHSKLKWAF
uniref:PAW domain-containing protein n=1 Tax=Arundo donax TaxID=35708 RepID=A0A0A8ZFZ2_ARUDO